MAKVTLSADKKIFESCNNLFSDCIE